MGRLNELVIDALQDAMVPILPDCRFKIAGAGGDWRSQSAEDVDQTSLMPLR